MRLLLLTIALALLDGCRPTSPTPPVVQATPTIAQISPTVQRTPLPGLVADPAELCANFAKTLQISDAIGLTLNPPTPQPGDQVVVTGTGFPVGDFRIWMGTPQSDGDGVIRRISATVRADGTLRMEFVMPSYIPPGEKRCLVVNVGNTQFHRYSNPFLVTGIAPRIP